MVDDLYDTLEHIYSCYISLKSHVDTRFGCVVESQNRQTAKYIYFNNSPGLFKRYSDKVFTVYVQFLRYVIFADQQISGFSLFYFQGSLVLH